MFELSLIIIVLLVLVLPMSVHLIEKNLEVFLFFMGILAVSVSHFLGHKPILSWHLIRESLTEPIMITAVVLVVGILVYLFKKELKGHIGSIEKFLGQKLFCFALIFILGILSSVITAIMAAIILVEVISALNYDRDLGIKLVVLGCFSIGFGAALTPLGEPLSTICIAKLKGAPYYADFFFLLRELGFYIIPGIILIGLLSIFVKPYGNSGNPAQKLSENDTETMIDVIIRAGKVYVFIMALIFLGAGFKPIIDMYIIKLPSEALYWINTVSAIMDNATLTAAEISPGMKLPQIQSALLGLLIAGGMLIPGNIPNIISAGRLGIKSKEWAKIGVPLGFVIMIIYFVILSLF